MAAADNTDIWWYYAIDGQQQGPVDGDELRRLVASGRIKPTDLVWNETMGDQWAEARTLPHLFEAAPLSADVDAGAADEPPPPPPETFEDEWFALPRPIEGDVSVSAPVGVAWDRMKRMLFQPFDIAKWFTLAFGAWLTTLAQQGSGFVNMNPGDMGPVFEGMGGGDGLGAVVIGIIVVVVVIVLAIWAALLWVGARGSFMFLDNVVRHRQAIAEPWKAFAGAANSYFRWRLVFALITVVLLAMPVLLALPAVILPSFRAGDFQVESQALFGVSIGLFLIGLLVIGFVQFLAKVVVVPVMYLRGCRVMDAWRETMALAGANKGPFVLYWIFTGLLGLLSGTIVTLAVLVTCGILCCLISIPYVSAVAMLPIFVFFECYALEYLAQYGPRYDVWSHESLARPAPESPAGGVS